MTNYSLNNTAGVKVADITEKTPLKGKLLRIEEKRFHGEDFVNRELIFQDGFFSIAGTAYQPIDPKEEMVLISNFDHETLEEHCVVVSMDNSPTNEEDHPFNATIYIK